MCSIYIHHPGNSKFQSLSLQPSWCRLKYANCISCRDVRPPTKRGVMGMILNCIWCWGSSSWTLESMEYFFIVITVKCTLTQTGRTCQAPIYGSNTSIWKLLQLDRYSWNHITENKWLWNQLVLSYNSPNMATAWKNSHSISSEKLNFHIINNM